jgi:hypothetical protein
MAAGAKGRSARTPAARTTRSAAGSAVAIAARTAPGGSAMSATAWSAPGTAVSAWIGAGQSGSRAHCRRPYRPSDCYSRCQFFQIHGHPPLCL